MTESEKKWNSFDAFVGLILASSAIGYLSRPAFGFLFAGLFMLGNAIWAEWEHSHGR